MQHLSAALALILPSWWENKNARGKLERCSFQMIICQLSDNAMKQCSRCRMILKMNVEGEKAFGTLLSSVKNCSSVCSLIRASHLIQTRTGTLSLILPSSQVCHPFTCAQKKRTKQQKCQTDLNAQMCCTDPTIINTLTHERGCRSIAPHLNKNSHFSG